MILKKRRLVYNKIMITFTTVFRRVLTALRLFEKSKHKKVLLEVPDKKLRQ